MISRRRRIPRKTLSALQSMLNAYFNTQHFVRNSFGLFHHNAPQGLLDDINISTASSGRQSTYNFQFCANTWKYKKETGSPVNCFYLFSRLLFFFMLPCGVVWCCDAFLWRYSVSVTTKQTPFESPSFSHIFSTLSMLDVNDLCTHRPCLELFKMKPIHFEPLSFSVLLLPFDRIYKYRNGKYIRRQGWRAIGSLV